MDFRTLTIHYRDGSTYRARCSYITLVRGYICFWVQGKDKPIYRALLKDVKEITEKK